MLESSTLTAADLMTRLYIFADDSMMGRDAFSEYNAKGTAYIASELACAQTRLQELERLRVVVDQKDVPLTLVAGHQVSFPRVRQRRSSAARWLRECSRLTNAKCAMKK